MDHHAVLEHGYKPFFSPQARTGLRDLWIPPNRMRIWIGRLTTTRTNSHFARSAYSDFGGIKPIKHLAAYTFTLSALELVIQTISVRNIRRPASGGLTDLPERAFSIRPSRGHWNMYLINILPDVRRVSCLLLFSSERTALSFWRTASADGLSKLPRLSFAARNIHFLFRVTIHFAEQSRLTMVGPSARSVKYIVAATRASRTGSLSLMDPSAASGNGNQLTRIFETSSGIAVTGELREERTSFASSESLSKPNGAGEGRLAL